MTECDVFIIGGGPAGSIAAAKLVQAGYSVELVEKIKFPRFVIGESLLPRCNELLEEAGMLEAVENAGFQFKGGVAFQNEQDDIKVVNFEQNMGQKHNSSFQVRRETFDKLLLDEAEKFGAHVTMESEVTAYNETANVVTVVHKDGSEEKYHAKKVIDASGYGRVLPRLLDLDAGSALALRDAVFCRVEGDIRPTDGTDGYIYVYVVGDNDAWIWNIPLSPTVTSVGIVCSDAYYRSFNMDQKAFWEHIIANDPHAKKRYAKAKRINEVGFIGGYSSNVKKMFGDNFVMVGNATEFLDPVFSSGVTLALESGAKAADLTIKEFKGEAVDWQRDYEDYMMIGVNVFREYVEAWYDGRLQSILFSKTPGADKIERKVVSVLSGYVWDKKNMFVNAPTEAVNATYKALTGVDPY
ncbi:NAD(P)/FAD-dependent oxidoreductase [Sulfurimonas sp. HSL3-7]|uniref:NAD(P)/FAD-dependent oxidoreductase n=1 Tax=Sulfonitrofixus jiaomeiensis TaxID=3131938 RepID=UPI0031F8BF11